jgi:natural product precursor
MKLESLKLDKFKDNSLKREQMFNLNGGGTATEGGHACQVDEFGRTWELDYGYDAIRDGVVTYHNRTNRVRSNVICKKTT